VGFKLAIGHPWEWFAIAKAMVKTGIQPDFIVVDGAEGGTGAAPLEFTNHVGAAAARSPAAGAQHAGRAELRDRSASARPARSSRPSTSRAPWRWADWCNAARGFMFALGCIQSQSCHTSQCPTGVATQDPLRQRALVVPDKAERVHLFHKNTLKALKELLAAAGLEDEIGAGDDHRRLVTAGVRVVREARRVWRGGTQRGRDLEWRCARVVGRQ
jgi:glutamate synthase domain-containing protein 2